MHGYERRAPHHLDSYVASASFRFRARISLKRMGTLPMIAAMLIIWPSFCSGTMGNSTEIVAPSLRTAGTEWSA